jgi:hypothetical protein
MVEAEVMIMHMIKKSIRTKVAATAVTVAIGLGAAACSSHKPVALDEIADTNTTEAVTPPTTAPVVVPPSSIPEQMADQPALPPAANTNPGQSANKPPPAGFVADSNVHNDPPPPPPPAPSGPSLPESNPVSMPGGYTSSGGGPVGNYTGWTYYYPPGSDLAALVAATAANARGAGWPVQGPSPGGTSAGGVSNGISVTVGGHTTPDGVVGVAVSFRLI